MSKIIFKLLTEVVILHMRVTIIQIGISELEKPIEVVLRTWWSLILGLFNAGLNELSEEHIGRS